MKKRLTKAALFIGVTTIVAIGAYGVKTGYASDSKESCTRDVKSCSSEKIHKDK